MITPYFRTSLLLTSTDVTGPSVVSVRTTLPSLASHTISPGKSDIDVTNKLSLGPTNTAALMGLGAPANSTGGASGRSTSYNRSIFSCPPVTSLLLHCEKLQVLTMCLCCSVAFSRPVNASHILAEKSADAVAARVAEGSRAQDHTAPYKAVHNAGIAEYATRGRCGARLLLNSKPSQLQL